MYRVALDDPRLFLPAPVYRLRDGRYLMREGVAAARAWDEIESVPFFALPKDRRRQGTVSIDGLFHAVAIGADGAVESATGDWTCRTNDDTDFALAITEQRGIRLGLMGQEFTKGSFRDGALAAEVTMDGITYRLGARYTAGKLEGGWAEDGGGTFTCTRPDTGDWRRSRALVPLYSYDGKYTVEPRTGVKPVALVWRNPLTVLPLDRDAAATVQ
jgi:hypothetical protein